MTVIVFKNGVMGSDSLATFSSGLKTYGAEKIYRLSSGALLGRAGDLDCREIINLVDTVTCESQMPSKHELSETRCDFEGLLALPDSTLWLIEISMVSYENSDEWNGYLEKLYEPIASCGSGAEIALGALEAGASVERALEIAIHRNAYCGGDLQVDKIANWKTIKNKKEN